MSNTAVSSGDDSRKRSEHKAASSPESKRQRQHFSSNYNWEDVHSDLEAGRKIGTWGGANATYWGLSSVRARVNMADWHKRRGVDEHYIEDLDVLLRNPRVRSHWAQIVSFDPLGMYAHPPTIAATTAHMRIPELTLEPDGKVVNEDGSVNVVKAAIDLAWNLPRMAERLNMQEDQMRRALYEYTENKHLLNPDLRVFLPPVGGISIYFFGDLAKLADPSTEVAVRVHDSCCGSDVFGTDICTCRPYLIFAIQSCVECAQRGGVGIVAYYQKEGRSLGEVTKFRVYNARKRQEGGDRPEKYFYQTESIAGIRDARFQETMPDVLLWLGIERIDWLLSMSSDKYDGITQAGIEVRQRVPLPDMYVPANAQVEITAKISAGYHTEDVHSSEEIVHELRDLATIRKRCGAIFQRAKENKAVHFVLNLSNLDKVVDYVIETTKERYPDLAIPYHSRWRQFEAKDVEEMVAAWPCDKLESVRRLVDLATISVLLDAGAGARWKYIDFRGKEHGHTEGLANASMDMFQEGLFSSDSAIPHRVNSHGLRQLSLKQLQKGFQVTEKDGGNKMVGLDSRFGLLQRLSDALEKHPEYFGREVARPGNMVDYVLKHVVNGRTSIKVLWKAVVEGFETIWPNNLAAVIRGDVWVYSPLKQIGKPGSDLVPFHRLSQWLTYSLLEPFDRLGIHFDELELLTALAEYRNGGLYVDFDVLTPRDPRTKEMEHNPGSELVTEWRALTVCLVDLTAEQMRAKLNRDQHSLPLPKVLQGGTWAAGRKIAGSLRPGTKRSPIPVRVDQAI